MPGDSSRVMIRIPRSSGLFLLLIPVVAVGLGASVRIERSTLPSSDTFLEDALIPYQEKSLLSLRGKMSQSVLRESISVGRLIAGQADPSLWSEDSIRDLSLYIVLKSREYNLSPLLVLSVIYVESRFQPQAISPKGAVGLMQLMPATAQELATRLGMPYAGPGSLYDPKFNIELGLRYLVHLKTRFPSKEHVLTAYNIGPNALKKKLRNGEALPLSYYRKVMDIMAVYNQQAKANIPIAKGRNSQAWL